MEPTFKTPSGLEVTASGQQVSGSAPVSGVSTDSFMEALQSRLLGSAGAVSSEDTQIEAAISKTMENLQKGNEASKASAASQFDRAIGETKIAGEQALTSFNEASRGYAVNTAALRQLKTDTEKSVKDLEQRKQEALLGADAAMYAKLSDLQIKKLEFQQQAEQRVFTNLLSLGQFAAQRQGLDLQRQEAARADRAQSFQEKSALSTIALKYGLAVAPGDTLESITLRAKNSPAYALSTQKEKLEIEKLNAEIKRANAETAKALRGDKFVLDGTTAGAMATTYTNLLMQGRTDEANFLLSSVEKQFGAKGLEQLQAEHIKTTQEEFRPDNLRKNISEDYSSGATKGDIFKTISDNPFATAEQKAEALRIAEELAPKKSGSFIDSLFMTPSMREAKKQKEDALARQEALKPQWLKDQEARQKAAKK